MIQVGSKREKNVAFYSQEQTLIDQTSGEVLSSTIKTVAKTSPEPDFIKLYYETMMAFNQIHDIPVSFVLSMSQFITWTNEGRPMTIVLNKMNKEIMCQDCGVSFAQMNRYISHSVKHGLLFKTDYRGVYEVNPFLIAKGKWDSIKRLQTQFDFVNGKWIRLEKTEPVQMQVVSAPAPKTEDTLPNQMEMTEDLNNPFLGLEEVM